MGPVIVFAGFCLAVLSVVTLRLWSPERRAVARDARRDRIARDMARHLERAANDPLLRTSQEWEDEATRLVRDWYGD